MKETTLLVKNMVCSRCITAVEEILKDMAIPYTHVQLGEVETVSPLDDTRRAALAAKLNSMGFDIIDTKVGAIIEKIKQLIIARARNQVAGKDARLKLSTYLSDRLHHEYTYLSNLFSSVVSRTIENYFIEQRIEYVKELLVYGELNLSEIAAQLEYSSTAHLSAQFKKITGLTPSHYKQVGAQKRKGIDEV